MDKDPTGPKDKIIKFFGSFRNRKKHLDDISSLKHFKLPGDCDLESELEAAFQKLSPEEKAHVENSDDDAFFTFPPPPRHYPRFLLCRHQFLSGGASLRKAIPGSPITSSSCR
jgi:hypothetical protein